VNKREAILILLFSSLISTYFYTVYNKWQIAKKYLHYRITASNGKGHGTHSPFVFSLITKVLNDKRHFYAYDQVEQLRQLLLRDEKVLEVEDFGAGSSIMQKKERRISQIARHSAKAPRYARLLYRLVNHFSCSHIIELGTSLGISSAYMALANNFSHVITCEGSHAIAQKARENFNLLQIPNITLLEGTFEKTFPEALAQMPQVDLLFVDGNHRREPTLAYFQQALEHIHENSIMVFDDIHWSRDMEAAWEEIKQHPAVSETADLFFLGLVFFRSGQKAPQHFTIRY
jgi:predicted O-methyltransferase YrrM